MLDASGARNHSGNNVTTLILSIAIHPPPRAGRANLRPPPATIRLRTPAAIRGDRSAGARSRAVPPESHARRSARRRGPSARTPFPDFRPGESPRLPPAGRAACAAARLRAGRFSEYAGLLEERTHRVRGRRALLEPGPRLLGVDVD